jgi:hypothetical protein
MIRISKEYRRSLLPSALFIVAYLTGIALLTLKRSCWHDECHFVDTIMQFEYSFTLSTLMHYNEMSMPLPFMLYAVWGRIFGDSLLCLRLFSLCIAGSTLFAFHFLFFHATRNRRVSFLLLVFLTANPYMAGASGFVFTDMLMMFFLALFLIGGMRHNLPLLCLSSMAGLLCRQYFIFATGAGIVFFLLAWATDLKELKPIRLVGALLISMLPLLALFAFWHGVSPDNALKNLYLADRREFHVNSLTLYITMIAVYAFPVCFAFRNYFYRNIRILFCSFLLSFLYWLYPIVASAVALSSNKDTVGYFHKLLRIWPGARLEHYVFYAFFTLSLPVVLKIGLDCLDRIRQRRLDFSLFLGLAVFAFLLVMPFSYLHWEKYLLPLLPILALYCSAVRIIDSGRTAGIAVPAPESDTIPQRCDKKLP